MGTEQPTLGEQAELCQVSGLELTASGVAKDAIPALSNPTFVEPGHLGTTHLFPQDLVIGMVVAGEALAFPMSIMWWHEIVNLDRTGVRLAVTYCPLTGTAMAFDRTAVGNRDLGVSGLLLENNLVMYDRTTDESLWGQMLGGAICGSAKGRTLPRVPLLVTTYDGWRTLHPDTRVVSSDTGYDRNYSVNPYVDYERLDAPPLYESQNNRDHRRQPKEKVLGIPGPGGDLAVPFQDLEVHERTALNVTVGQRAAVVLWDRDLKTAAAYGPEPEWAPGFDPGLTGPLTFRADESGYVDEETGSVWSIEGVATAGPAEGSTLVMLEDALVAFWFAWATFNPGTEIFEDL